MKIVVIGGTALIGSKTVASLRQDGHEAVAASPNTGVNSLTEPPVDDTTSLRGAATRSRESTRNHGIGDERDQALGRGTASAPNHEQRRNA